MTATSALPGLHLIEHRQRIRDEGRLGGRPELPPYRDMFTRYSSAPGRLLRTGRCSGHILGIATKVEEGA